MLDKYPEAVEKGRVLGTSRPCDKSGHFRLDCPVMGQRLTVIASGGEDWEECGLPGMPWEHVSVSTHNRTPTWEEMCWVKDQFFGPDEVVVQYHPARVDYVNFHRYTLHMWKPVGVELPKPPTITI